MLKTHTYPDSVIEEIGKTPNRSLRLDRDITVQNPKDADFIIVPASLADFKSLEDMRQLPLFNEMEDKHVFFSCGEYEIAYGTTAVLIQCDLRTWKLAQDVNAKSCAWPVGKDDIDNCAEIPEEGFTYDVGFHGWMSSESRHLSVESVKKVFGGSFDSICYPDFYGYVKGEELNKRRKLFLNSLKNCRIQLCPQSRDGVFPYRFWESMCAGRIPALVCSNYVLPRTDIIDYDEFILTIPAEQANRAGEIIKEYLNNTPDEALTEKGKRAREAYTQKLDSRNWDRFFRETLEHHLWNSK